MSENEVNITIANRLATAHDKMNSVTQKAGLPSNYVKLMAVSKTKDINAITEAYEAGQRIFGENYAQELAEKQQQLNQLSETEWHFIGPIQSNKTSLICKHANWVDSVDRIKVARRLNQHCADMKKQLNILVQVNISDSDTKSGVPLKDVHAFVGELQGFEHLNVRGLMAIPDELDCKNQMISEFNALNTCFSELKHQYPSVDTLSLGMTNDWEDAILSGSTMIRLGTAIFGPRSN